MEQTVTRTKATKGRVLKATKATEEAVNNKVLGKLPEKDIEGSSNEIKKRFFSDTLVNGNLFCHINWYYPGGPEAFKYDTRLQYVSKCYPYAEGKKLLVDEAKNEAEAEWFKEKKTPLMKELKFRYVILLRGAEIYHELD